MLIENQETLLQALAFIKENELLAYDTETTGLNVRKDKVIGFGFSTSERGCYLPLYSYDVASDSLRPHPYGSTVCVEVLAELKKKRLIMFNASFDARVTKHSLKIDLLDALYADVLLLKHTCDEEFPFGLKEIATKLWGIDVKKEKEEMQASIKANGGKVSEYFKADTILLSKYCIQDCMLTFRIYEKYLSDLRSQGLESFYFEDEVMPLYREVTIPMEDKGIRLNVPLLESTLKEITEDINKIESQIQTAIAPKLDIFTSWFLNKDYPLETYTGKPSLWRKHYKTQYEAWRQTNNGYMFNLQSKHHLKKLFFDTLKEEPLSRTEKGNPQVDDEFLEKMALKYEWCSLLQDYNKLNKLKGTYIERLLSEHEDGIFYPAFQQHRTVSGRYAGDLQQLPRKIDSGASPVVIKYTNLIRSFIIPRHGCKLISADYEQLEPTIFAHTSGDTALQDIFNKGLDFYSEVAIRTERLPEVSSDKKALNYLGLVNKTARQKAKAYALGIAYGMTGYKLKFELGCSVEVADSLVKDYLTAFPQLATWMQESQDKAKYLGYVQTQMGRKRRLGKAKWMWAKYGYEIKDSLALWKKYNHNPEAYAKVKEDYKTFKNLMNNAINFQVQGLAASIMNRASISIARTLRKNGLKTCIVAQVHDELVFEAPVNELDIVCSLIQHIMENIVKLSVPLRTVPQVGASYAECK